MKEKPLKISSAAFFCNNIFLNKYCFVVLSHDFKQYSIDEQADSESCHS